MARTSAIVGLLVVGGVFAAQLPKADDRGPGHPPDDPQSFPIEPNPYFNSELLRYVEDKLPIQNARQNRYEAQCYEELFQHARSLPADLLRRASGRGLKYYQLFGEDRALYRGCLTHVEGPMRMLRAYEPPARLRDDAGGWTEMYEAWVFDTESGGNPYCVIFSEKPDNLKAVEREGTQYVETDGFFFKRYRYGAQDGPRDAPLLIARSIRPIAAPRMAKTGGALWDLPLGVLLTAMAAIGVVIVAAGGTWLWFRRDDARARERLKRARQANPPSDWGDGGPTADRGPFGGSPSLN
ncbi:MAG: hypothetical protein U0746_04660 [Gemmataceae bacterium]